MDIRALTPDLAEDFFAFFDQRAFSDNPAWKGCYCTFYHRPERILDVEGTHRLTRREQAKAFIRDGVLRGYLAYEGELVVGWCNANRKANYLRLDAHAEHAEQTLAIVCFVIDPARRRQGIARALLTQALDDAARSGLHWAEAYPAPRSQSESGNFHGHLALYETLGFQRVPGRKLVVRKELRTQ